MHDYTSRNTAFYTPLSSLGGRLPEIQVERLLIAKSIPDLEVPIDHSGTPHETRSLVKRIVKSLLPEGLYVFKSVGLYDAVIVLGGTVELQNSLALDFNRSVPDDSPLFVAKDLLEDYWDEAIDKGSQEVFAVHDWAVVKGNDQFGIVMDVSPGVEASVVTLEIDGERKRYQSTVLEKIAGDPKDPKTWIRNIPCGPDGVTNIFTWAKLNHALSDTLYSYAATRTVFRPYQFLPALKMLNSERGRLLVADEVGLGKTIEAGLIWAELDQRHDLKRVLIVAPAALSVKWKLELRRRFMRDVQIWKLRDLDVFLDKFEESPDARCAAIISLETLRTGRDQQRRLHELSVGFDLVIFDEAHAIRNRGKRGYQLGELLGDLAEYLVFLSATPLNLGKEDFFNLMHLLEPDLYRDKEIFLEQIEPNKHLNDTARQFMANNVEAARSAFEGISGLAYGKTMVARPGYRELSRILAAEEKPDAETKSRVRELCLALNTTGTTFTRTRKREVPDRQAEREPIEVLVEWTPEEREFYEVVHEHFYEKAISSGKPPSFIMQMPLRQTCSSIPVMQAKLRREGLSDLIDLGTYAETEDLPELADESYPAGDINEQDTLSSRIGSLVVTKDSKLAALLAELKKLDVGGSKQALVFTFFRGTVEYLGQQLSRSFRVGMLHGGIKPEDRELIIQDFREGRLDIVVANQVGSEGLDFQFCNVLVNYDLPWNPMQVEQRIGRLDRFGQQNEKIFILNMKVPDTIESDIFLRLYNRIDLFRQSVGDLEPILRDAMDEMPVDLYNPALSEQQKAAQVEAQAAAIANEQRNRERLENEANLLIAGHLEIQGLTADGPSNGKYIGEGELAALVGGVVARFGGQLMELSGTAGFYYLTGSDDLARNVAKLNSSEVGTSFGAGLAQRLRDKEKLVVTFNSMRLQNSGLEDSEIISSRHPLVRLAVELETRITLLNRRFGRCSLKLEGFQGRYLAEVDLADSAGVAPRRELWVTAIDLETGERCDRVESALMEAVAAGRLEEAYSESVSIPSELRSLDRVVHARHAYEQKLRSEDNAALVRARRQSELQLNKRKIERFTRAVEEGTGLEGVNRAMLLKAQAETAKIEEKYDQAQQLNLNLQPVALVYIQVD